MTANVARRYYPRLSELVTLQDLPAYLQFIQTGANAVFSNLHYKNLQYSKSPKGDAAFYSLDLVSSQKLSVPIPGGMELVLNPDYDVNISSIPISIQYQWGILAYLTNFNLKGFDFSVQSMYKLGLQVFRMTDEELIGHTLTQLVKPVNEAKRYVQLVNDLNAKYGTNILAPNDENESLKELVSRIVTQGNFPVPLPDVIYETYLNDVDQALKILNVESFFSIMMPNGIEAYLKSLIKPSFKASLKLSAALEFPRSILVPVYDQNGNHPTNPTLTPNPKPAPYSVIPADATGSPKVLLNMGEALFYVDSETGLGYSKDITLSTNLPAQIGNTGFIINFENVKIDVSTQTNIPEATADGRPNDFVGVFMGEAEIILPSSFTKATTSTIPGTNALRKIVGKNILAGTGGFSGIVGLETNVAGAIPFKIGNFEIAITDVGLNFHMNKLLSSTIAAKLKIPALSNGGSAVYADVNVFIKDSDNFKVTGNFKANPLTISCFDVFDFNIETIAYEEINNRKALGLSGVLSFKNDIAGLGDLLPKNIAIEKLIIYDDGDIDFKLGSIPVPPFNLKLGVVEIGVHGLSYTVSKLGTRKYGVISFDGNVNSGVGGFNGQANGVKLYFSIDGGSTDIFLRVESIRVSIKIPADATPEQARVLIDGFLSVRNTSDAPNAPTEYGGGIAITLNDLGISAGASMKMTPSVPSFIVDLGLELSVPIPLGPTGLGLYGFRGLIGNNYHVNREEDETWWKYYKRKDPREGIHIDGNKFIGDTGFNLGAGTTIGTIGDSGYALNSKVFVMLGLPRLLLLQGQTAMLKKRLGLNDPQDPPFVSFMAIDEESISSGMGINYLAPAEGEDAGKVINMQGLSQMAFFYKDSSAWYVNFGKDLPVEERMRARLFDLIDAYAYLTLPTNTDDFRLPFVPSLASFTHNGQSLSAEVIDENGYSYFEANRLVNVNRNMLPYEVAHNLTPEDLLSTTDNYFNLGGEKTKPFSLGIEYGLLNLNPDKELPNVAHDKVYPAGTEYKDFKGGSEIDETILVLDNSNPLYTHLELEEGIHKYALYGVNWFSRASSVSAEDALETTFVNKNIKPPVNLQAHYIQREDPVVFTSIAEQNELEQRINATPEIPDPNLTRVTFDWNGYQNGNYQDAKEVHFYFRGDLPETVKGKISLLTEVSGTGNYLVTTDKIKLISTDGSFMEPIVAYPQKMVGSELKTQSGAFKIISCSANAQGYLECVIEPPISPKLIQESNELTDGIEYRAKQQQLLPQLNEYFSVRANITSQDDWYKLDSPSNKVVITNFVDANSNPHTEEFIDSDNKVLTQVVGGIFKETGSVTKLDDEVTGMDDLYEITLSYNLSLVPPGNNGNNVNYHEGSVRLKTTSGKIRELRVFSISGFGTSSLTLLAHDVNADASDPIKTSGVNFINFHPGYRIYLSSEGDFYSENIEPGLGSDLKKTWLAAKSYDFDNDYYVTDPFLAPFSTPVTLLATREKQPLAPGNFVVNTKFATRPDSFGKASYSIDLLLGEEKPFSTAFYRTTNKAILSVLYDESTLSTVLENLKDIEVNNDEDRRFEELVAGTLNENGDAFKEYNGYALPLPTLNEGESQGTAAEIVQRVKNRIESTLLPVTAEPCIYSFIKTRNSGLTSNKKPVLTDDSGNLLLVNDVNFDPYPFMSKVNVSGEGLRYTDYTLSGNSNARYFYAFKHQADNLKMSAWSDIVGPVSLINSSMFEAPIIEKYEILLANKVLETKPSVKFSIQPFPEITGVKNVRLYRTFSSASAKNLLSMDVVGDFDLTQEEVIDSFNSIVMPPTEEDIFYRLVGLREVRTEQKLDEQNPNSEFKTEIYFSEATDVVVVQLPDNINPSSPELKCTCTGNSANQLLNVAIEFDAVMYKGTYYLYKLNNNGAWEIIDQIENAANTNNLSFSLGDLIYSDGTNRINHLFKVVVRNKSGLFSPDQNQVNPVSLFVPSPSVIGSRMVCINQTATYKIMKSNNENTLEWKMNNGIVGNADNVNLTWTSNGVFQVEVKETNPESGLSYVHAIQVAVKQLPVPSINGPINVCTYTELYYETTEVMGNYYNWLVQGGTIISGQGTHLVGVIWNEAGTGIIKVQESNGGCVVESSSLGVSVLAKPNPILVVDSNTVCTGQQLEFEIINFDHATSYTWEHNGQMIYHVEGVVRITWDTDGVKNIRVIATNGSCSIESNIVIVEVLISPLSGMIVGLTNPPINVPLQYTKSDYYSGNDIEWTISGNGVINSGQGTDTIEVIWQVVGLAEWIEVVESNISCNSPSVHLDVFPQ